MNQKRKNIKTCTGKIPDNLQREMMWDYPMCAVNMFHCHWLKKKSLCPTAGQNRAR